MQTAKPQCRFCNGLKGEKWFRCRHGRFDIKGRSGQIPRYFVWNGIWQPNKTVAVAQKDCPFFEVYPQAEFITKGGSKIR